VASLFPFLLKAGAPIDEKRFAFVDVPWFKTEHPVTYNFIQIHLKAYREQQAQLQAIPASEPTQQASRNPFHSLIERLGR
jgi:hypothetical protein